MKIGGVALALFLAKVASGVMETEKNFAEIIEIINESMVIKGEEELSDDDKKSDTSIQNVNFDSMNMGLALSAEDGTKKEFRWK